MSANFLDDDDFLDDNEEDFLEDDDDDEDNDENEDEDEDEEEEEKKPIFGDLRDEDIKNILAFADDETFNKLCNEIELERFCHEDQKITERIYELRIKNWFPKSVLSLKGTLKWKPFYQKLNEFFDDQNKNVYLRARKYMDSNNLLDLKLLNLIDNFVPTVGIYDYAIMNSNLSIIKWVESFFPDIIFESVVLNNYEFYRQQILDFDEDKLEWFQERLFQVKGRSLILPYQYQESINNLAENGKLNFLKWIYKSISLLPDKVGISKALNNKHYNVVSWINETTDKILVDLRFINQLTGACDVKLLQSFYNKYNILPSKEGINNAIVNNCTLVLEWIYNIQADLVLTENLFNFAIQFGNMNIVRWYLSKNPNLKPNEQSLRSLVSYNKFFELLEIYNLTGILPSEKFLKESFNKSPDKLDYHEKKILKLIRERK